MVLFQCQITLLIELYWYAHNQKLYDLYAALHIAIQSYQSYHFHYFYFTLFLIIY